MLIVFLMSKVESQDFLDPELIYSGGGGGILTPSSFSRFVHAIQKHWQSQSDQSSDSYGS